MNTLANQTQENKSKSIANDASQMQNSCEPDFQFVDNRPEVIAQTKLQEMANNSTRIKQLKTFQKIDNKGTRPDHTRNGNKSGNTMNTLSMCGKGVVQRVIATIGYDPLLVSNPDPLISEQHASIKRSLALLKGWHDGEPDSDINSLTDIGNKAQPLNILGHGSPDTIQSMSPADLAGKILRLKNKEKINAINLYSCSTHSKADGFAAQLKTILKEAGMNITIKAPAGLLGIGQAASESAGTQTYPPQLRVAFDTARDKMLTTLETFRQEAEVKMQKLKDEIERWEKIVNDRISEVMKDDKIPLIKKQEIIKLQSTNLIAESNKREKAIKEIDRNRKKIEKTSKEKYLSDRAKAVSTNNPNEGDALTEVNAIIEQSKLKELKKTARQILGLIEFENTPFEELDFSNSEIEFGEFVGAEDEKKKTEVRV